MTKYKKVERAYKYRIYPTDEQKDYLYKTFKSVCFIYNLILDDNIKHFKSHGKMLNKKLTEYKREDRRGLPNYKNIRPGRQSFTTNNQKGTIQIIDGKYLRIPKLNSYIKIKYHRKIPVNADIKTVTVSFFQSGEYYASIKVNESILQFDKLNNKIGIDLGIKNYVTIFDGKGFDNTPLEYPRNLGDNINKLKKLQEVLSRKEKRFK